jgi:hypothetical protein
MKGIVVSGLVIAFALLVSVLPAANVLASDEPQANSHDEQANPHDEIERIRARRHLRTNGMGSNSTENALAIPKELTPFVHGDEIPVYVDTADLEETGRLDYVLVVGTEDSEDKTMRIISRAASGALSVALSRGDVILCDGCGGMDEGRSIGVGKGAIEIQNTSGSASSGDQITCLFRYSKASQQWLLIDRIVFGWSVNTPEGTSETSVQHETAKDFGVVSLAGADISDRCY